MQEIIRYLMNNKEVLNMVNAGGASLVGISREEQNSILEVFFENKTAKPSYFWF